MSPADLHNNILEVLSSSLKLYSQKSDSQMTMSIRASVADMSDDMSEWIYNSYRNFPTNTDKRQSVFCILGSLPDEEVLAACDSRPKEKDGRLIYRLVKPLPLGDGWTMLTATLRTVEDEHMLHVWRATCAHPQHGLVEVDTTLRAALEKSSLKGYTSQALQAFASVLREHDDWNM